MGLTGIHVIVCDDHRTMRDALARFLGAQEGIASTSEAADADEAIRLIRTGADLLLLDLRLGHGENGLEVLEALHNLGATVPVLVMSGAGDLDLVARALSLGALGYVPKTASPQELHNAVVSVARGEAVIPEEVLGPLLRRLRAELRNSDEARLTLARLTAREREVLDLLAHGVGRLEIARRLNVSGNTVRTHLRHLMEKLGVKSQLAAAARARELAEALDSSRVRSKASLPLTIDLRDDEESHTTSA